MSVNHVVNGLILSFLLACMASKVTCGFTSKEKLCAAEDIDGESVICVCNSTYCDEFIRETPVGGQYIAYTSSKCVTTLIINPNKGYQKIEGFGGAITDAAGINIMSLPPETRQLLINSYFSSHGLEYNMLRLPIGGTDFSTRYYAYNEIPEDDLHLTNYTLSQEDYDYKIPVIRSCMEASTSPVHIVGSVWAPPNWMLDYSNIRHLKKQYMQTYALYYLKFLELYSKNGIDLWAITTGNEPLIVVGWSPKNMGNWILNNLGPTIRNSSFKDIKILAVDDMRFTIYLWFNSMLMYVPAAEQFIDGIAVHAYANIYTPASLMNEAVKNYPNIFVISTEASEGGEDEERVALGSWERAESYITDILENLCNNVVGWIDWNMCLDMEGGPNWVQNYVDAPIIVNAEKGEFYKQPMYYAIGQFAKFLRRDSRRLELTNKTVCPVSSDHEENNLKVDECNSDHNIASCDSVAFHTPNNTIVVVIFNRGPMESVVINYNEKQTTLLLEASSVTTVEFSAEDCEHLEY